MASLALAMTVKTIAHPNASRCLPVANATGKANAMTALGAELFFWSRLAYTVIYLAGIPWVRTAAWGVSIVGLLLILVQLI